MKSFLIRSLVLSAALLAPAFAVQPFTTSDGDALVSLASNPIVARGTSRETVDIMLGTPGAKLSPDVWVYWDFKMKGVAGNGANDVLVVGFTGDRVTFLRLSRSEPVRAYIAQQQGKAVAKIVSKR